MNHGGSLPRALRLVDAAAAAGADAVKFQTFRADALVTAQAPKAAYQRATTGPRQSQLAMLRRLEIDAAAHLAIAARCRRRGIRFLSTPFDEEAVDLLVGRLGVPLLKLPSGEITNGPLLLKAARTGRPVLLSTGMSDLADVEAALGVLAFGYAGRAAARPSRAAFRAAFASAAGRRALQRRVTLLHCTSEYPAPLAAVNLRAMDTLRERFGLPVGYSDHTPGTLVAVAAAARGAAVIEKHFTLDRALPGPDHRFSLEPGELGGLVRALREVERALGSAAKRPTPGERKNARIVRRSLVAARPIARGEAFTAENLARKRPGGGLSPMRWWDVLGKRAKRRYAADEEIEA